MSRLDQYTGRLATVTYCKRWIARRRMGIGTMVTRQEPAQMVEVTGKVAREMDGLGIISVGERGKVGKDLIPLKDVLKVEYME